MQGTIDALGSLYRALRAWKFYPKGHPARRSSILHAHSAMSMLLDGNNLQLSCGRTGFSFPDGEAIKDSTTLSVSLSYELFVRRVQKITFMQDLYQEDLLDFLRILAFSPESIQQAGGIDRIMVDHGIRSIWVNEFDLSVIRGKRREVESKGITPMGVDESEGGGETVAPIETPLNHSEELPPEQQLQALIGRLSATTDSDVYLILVRQAISCADTLKLHHEYLAIFPCIELLASHSTDASCSESIRESARFALEQLSTGEDFLRYIFSRMEYPDGLSKAALLAVLAAGRSSAVILAIEQMGITGSLAVRKTVATQIARLGEAAVPALLEMLGDRRWFIVRNIAAILGEIASSESVPGLIRCLQHTDTRVCKETIRSLARIGGREAESAIIGLLRENDTLLYPQAIASLGGMKSRRALTELMHIISSNDMFLKSLPLKTDALNAVAMIGDQQVVPRLLELLAERHILAARRGRELKAVVAQCLARLGDPRALPMLKELSSSPGALGVACAEAAELIEKAGGDPHGGS